MKMNRFALVVPFVISLGLGIAACSDDGNLGGTAGPGGGSSSGGSSSGNGSSSGGSSSGGQASSSGDPTKPIVNVEGDVAADKTLTAANRYLLKGLVKVKAGATLTIEKGTFIMGDNATKAILLVEPGGKIMAEGTADEPIIFTSQAPAGQGRAGDWGGVVILGKGPVNFPGGYGNIEGILSTASGTTYGGGASPDPNDNSGILRYIRIEYAGVVLSPDNEVNGLTFGGVGRGTKVDHIMVRHALDDCFEFFGGTVDAHHLICQYNQDDGFDFDNGYQGKLQFLVLQQDPNHPGEDNGFESDNDATGSANLPQTNPTVFNVTLCGKNADPTGPQFGMLIRRNSLGSYNNMIIGGFESNIDVRDATTGINATNGGLSIKGTWFWGAKSAIVSDAIAYAETGGAAPDKDNDGAFNEVNWIKTAEFANKFGQQEPGLPDCFNATAPGFMPDTSITEGAVTPPGDGFFDTSAKYLGAFKDSNDKWATTGNWSPGPTSDEGDPTIRRRGPLRRSLPASAVHDRSCAADAAASRRKRRRRRAAPRSHRGPRAVAHRALERQGRSARFSRAVRRDRVISIRACVTSGSRSPSASSSSRSSSPARATTTTIPTGRTHSPPAKRSPRHATRSIRGAGSRTSATNPRRARRRSRRARR
jgi:hypothetical protein